ncbi:MAG: lactate dehydrogenase [Eubacterium sp.]|nr:lactate dehydrogenase [Eubacterium sp.]
MKIFAYALRDFDEKDLFIAACEEAGVEFGYTAEYPSIENAHLAEGYQGISIITNPVGPELAQRFYDLGVRHISSRTIGMDHIDQDYCRKIGMKVSNISYTPDTVADYTVMMMLMALRKMPLLMKKAELQDFSLEGKIGRELRTCTVGVIGTGRIGRSVIRDLSGFGCRVICYDVNPAPDAVGQAEYAPLDTLLAESDIITLHAPGIPETYHMLGAEEIRRMKPGVILVNCARGSLIDTDAMIAALISGHIGYAALDTIEHEENLYYRNLCGVALDRPQRAQLLSLPNVLLSSHMAFYTEQAVGDMVRNSVRALGEEMTE